MAAMIESIGPVRLDLDNGKTYGRFLTAPDRAAELLNWGEVGELQIHRAAEIVKNEFGVTLNNTLEEYI